MRESEGEREDKERERERESDTMKRRGSRERDGMAYNKKRGMRER